MFQNTTSEGIPTVLPRRPAFTLRKTALLLLGISIVSGCATTTRQGGWLSVAEQNTQEGYEQFIKEYPDSEEAGEAKKRIEDPDYAFLVTCRIGTQKAFEGFLVSYPSSDYAPIGSSYLEFLRETKSGDLKSYKRFVSQHPDHPFVALAKMSIPVLWLKETGKKIGVDVKINGLINKGLLGGGYGDAEKTRQKVFGTLKKELENEGVQTVLLDDLESSRVTAEGVKVVVIADYSESKTPPTPAPIAYRPTDSAIANALYWDSGQTLADLLFNAPQKRILITVKGVDNGVEYYSGLRSLSSSVSRVNMNRNEALKAMDNHPSPAYAMVVLQEPNLSEPEEGRTDEELLKQLGRADRSSVAQLPSK